MTFSCTECDVTLQSGAPNGLQIFRGDCFLCAKLGGGKNDWSGIVDNIYPQMVGMSLAAGNRMLSDLCPGKGSNGDSSL